ncbi:hypothetical protein D3C80_964500 [compost metagenome]
MLIENARKQQTALQHCNLFFDVTFGLQRAIQPVFNFNILLNQRVPALRRLNQALAKLMVNIKLLLHQRIRLDARGFVRGDRFLRGFFSERQTFAVHRFLQELKLVFQTINVRRDIITLLLQGILQNGVAFQAFTLLVNLRIEQRLLCQQKRLLSGTQRALSQRRPVQAVTNLLKLLRGGVHRVLNAFRLRLQGDQLAVVCREIALPGL